MTDTTPRQLIAEVEAYLNPDGKLSLKAQADGLYGALKKLQAENGRLREVIAEIESDAIAAGGADDSATGNTYGDGVADYACNTLAILANARAAKS